MLRILSIWSAKSIPELNEMDVNFVQSIAGSVQKRLEIATYSHIPTTVHRKGYDTLNFKNRDNFLCNVFFY
jgi:hypothetical protein